MKNIIENSILDFDFINEVAKKPEVYEPGEPLFWNDDYISKQMLNNHLNPHVDGASRNKRDIEKTTKQILETSNLAPKSKILDLGCGPGLYAELFEKAGHQVVGIDYSMRSITYAQDYAKKNGLTAQYIYGDYSKMAFNFDAPFDLVVLIYGDYCVLTPQQRIALLKKIYNCLKPGGLFVFDVSTPTLRSKVGLKNNWSYHDGGFWKPSQHLVFEQGYKYENHLFLDQYVILDEQGNAWVYRNWFQDFTRESITDEIEINSDFKITEVWSDLKGTKFDSDSDWIGLVCKKMDI